MSDEKELLWYDLSLPVYAKGDDLSYYLEVFGHEPKAKAFLRLAAQYEEAAKVCKRVAAVMAEAKTEVDVVADEHVIEIGGKPEDLGGLIADSVLAEIEFSDLDEDDEADGEEDFAEEVSEDDDDVVIY